MCVDTAWKGKMSSNEDDSLPIKTVIKYEKTSCYFCDQWLESQSFKEHLIHCGQVLEPCPNSCSAYVQRKKMRSHLRDCPKLSRDAPTVSNGLEEEIESRMLVLEQDISALRSVLNEEIRQRLHLITDVGSLRKQNQVADEWSSEANQVMMRLQKLINEETESRTSAVGECQNDFRYCFDLLQSMKSEIEHSIEDLQKQITELSFDTKKTQNRIAETVIKQDENFFQQEKSFKVKIKQIEAQINQLSADLKSSLVSTTDLTAKHMKIDYEVKSMKNIVCETEDKCEKLERLVQNVDRALHHTMQSLSDLEVNLLAQYKMSAIQNTRGHLIWRINGFAQKFDDAKKHETILQSPVFCNRPYGYTLRVDIYLNGRGTWKGRNIIACLNVIPGEYDPLLQWPCKLQADVIIRDQNNDPSNVQDYVKTVAVRRKSEELHSNTFFFIPHKILSSRQFVKDDTLFFEVCIHKTKN